MAPTFWTRDEIEGKPEKALGVVPDSIDALAWL
jgi:hypothetical protein